MARLFLLVFENTNPTPLIKKLRAAGHQLVVSEPRWPGFGALLKQQTRPLDLFLADCSKLPSHARESCNYIQSLKSFKDHPFVLYNVKPEDDGKTLEKVRGARLVRGDDVAPIIDEILKARTPA